MFLSKAKQGSKLSMSYCIITQRNTSHSNENVTMPLGVIIASWKPTGLSLPKEFQKPEMTDEYDMAHGPLCISDVAPMIFYGPQCTVLNAPFAAKMLKVPSLRVGLPFRVTYQITNRTAKSQTLTYALGDDQKSTETNSAGQTDQLLINGKVAGEVQIAPFEQKLFTFTFMSMTAGRMRCPSFCVSSSRHQSWVIKESVVKEKYFFVMP